MKYMVTGCAGFIGSHFVDFLLEQDDVDVVIGIDKETYAAQLENLSSAFENEKFVYSKKDITDIDCRYMAGRVDVIVNFAAETHVDNSIGDSEPFIKTNIGGVQSLLESCRIHGTKMVQVSTDEVYGAFQDHEFWSGNHEPWNQESPPNPRNPYSVSKAAGDMLVQAYANTYDMGDRLVVTRCCNNFGPRQHEEKFLPKVIYGLVNGEPIGLYGDGQQRREWVYVHDHCRFLWDVVEDLKNYGGQRTPWLYSSNSLPLTNLEFIEFVSSTVSEMVGRCVNPIVEFIDDRPGHDRIYSMSSNCPRIRDRTPFIGAMEETIAWYTEKWGDELI
jgi:dTDP-glucose 4,6-dehydratase